MIINNCDFINGVLELLSFCDDDLNKIKDVLNYRLSKCEIHTTEKHSLKDEDGLKLLNKFIQDKRLNGCKEGTLERYYSDNKKLLDSVGYDLKQITTDDIREYMSNYQKNHKISKTTLNNMRMYFCAFFNWLEDEEYITKSPTRRIKRIKQYKIQKKPFTEEDLEKLRNGVHNLRDRAMIEFFISTGCRVGEVEKLNWSDIDFTNNECVVYGKGGKERTVYIGDRAMFYLKKYKEQRNTEGCLFAHVKGDEERLSSYGIENVFRTLGKETGIKKVHPHKARRYVATKAINNGMPIQEVKTMLGHEKIDTTMIYCSINKENLKISHRKYVG